MTTVLNPLKSEETYLRDSIHVRKSITHFRYYFAELTPSIHIIRNTYFNYFFDNVLIIKTLREVKLIG